MVHWLLTHRVRPSARSGPAASALRPLVLVALLAAAATTASSPAVAWAGGASGAVDLPAAPTPISWSLVDLERAQLGVADANALAKRVAALHARRTWLQQARARAPMAADAATRDMDLAEIERDLSLVSWHGIGLACARETASAATQKAGTAKASANGPVKVAASACPPAALALGEAVLAFQRLLAERPQHHRAPEVQIQIALLTLRQARADNDVARALAALGTLTRLEQELPASLRRAEATIWLAEDDANQGRTDLAFGRWAALAGQRDVGAWAAYAQLRLGWEQWHRGDRTDALVRLGNANSEATRLGSAKSALAQRASADRRWMQARVDAERLAAEQAAREAEAAVQAEQARAAEAAAAGGGARNDGALKNRADGDGTGGNGARGEEPAKDRGDGKAHEKARGKARDKASDKVDGDGAPKPESGAHWPRKPAPQPAPPAKRP